MLLCISRSIIVGRLPHCLIVLDYKEIKNICKYAYISNTSYNIPHIYHTSYYNSKNLLSLTTIEKSIHNL